MKSFYKGKKVLITGNTGFKGVWLTNVLINFQAEIFGYALRPLTNPSLYDLLSMETKVSQIFGDIRDFELLKNTFKVIQPEIVFHLAAQPLVGYSYQNPRETYDVNVMGTVNVMECIKQSQSVKSVVVITTDKVYQDNEWIYPYRETDILNGFDPYSNSKSCAELVVGSYNNSFIYRKNIPVSTVRSGNVIGGGDFSDARIVPDFLRAFINMESLLIKNPSSVRPYQHVLEPLVAYLLLAKKQYYDFS